jgi:hypothetical protein
MTNSEEEFAGKIKGYLDQSVAGLKPGVAYRLREMRTAVLDRMDEAQLAPGLVPAGAHGMAALPRRRTRSNPLSLLLALLIVAAGVIGYQQWTSYQQVKVFEELDAQILSSDLPIDAYLDGGFAAWLKTSTED